MATRMQQRRGTASQWTTADPILNAGEIGFESDTNKFKIGDGINHWADLQYFIDETALNTSLGSYIDSDLLGAPNGVAQLNSSGLLVSSQIPNIDEITQDAINTALVAGTGLDKTYDDNGNTITLDIDSTVATKTYADTAVSTHSSDTTDVHGITDTAELATKAFAASLLTGATKSNITITGDKNGLTITAENGVADSTTDNLTEGSTNKYFTDERAQDAIGLNVGTGLSYNDSTGAISVDTTAIQARVTNVSDTEIGYLDGVTSSIQTQINTKAPSAAPTFTGTVTLPSTTSIGNVSSTELGYLDGVTSSIQTQLDSKAPTASPTFTGTAQAASLTVTGNLTVGGTTTTVKAENLSVHDNMIYLNNATTGTITGATGTGSAVTYTTSVDHNISSGSVVKISGMNPSSFNLSSWTTITGVTANTFTVASAITDTFNSGGTATFRVAAEPDLGFAGGYDDGSYKHTGLFRDGTDNKWKFFDGYTPEPDASPYIDTSDGSFALADVQVAGLTASSITVGSVSNTEFGYLDGVTSAIQTQLDAKAPLSGPTFSGTVTLPSTTSIGNVSSTELGYLDGVTSAIQTQLDSKLASSTASSTYAPLAAPTFTGTVTLPSTTSIGNVSSTELGYLDGVTSAIQTQLDAKLATSTAATTYAPLASPTFTGTVTIPTGASITTPSLTLSTTTSTSEGRIAWDSTLDKIIVGNGSTTSDFASSTLAVNQQATDYTLVLSDKDKIVEMGKATAQTLTIPTNSTVAFPIGTQINIVQTGAGQVTVAGAGVTINATPGLKIRAQWASCTLIKRDTNTWVVIGDLTS